MIWDLAGNGMGLGVNTTGQGAAVDSILHEGHFSGARNGSSDCISICVAIPRDLEGKSKGHIISASATFFLSLIITRMYAYPSDNQ